MDGILFQPKREGNDVAGPAAWLQPRSKNRKVWRPRSCLFLIFIRSLSLSLDDLVRSRQHIGRDRDADLLGCF